MIKKLVIGIIILLELFAFKLWFSCKDFLWNMQFSAFDTKLRIDSEIANDKGYTVHAVRIFHNKLFATVNDIFNQYLAFWHIHFLALLFSLVGLFGIFYGFWYVVTHVKRKLFKWGIVFLILVLPFIEVFKTPLPFWFRITVVWGPYAFFSLYGIWQFLKQYKTKGLVLVTCLILLSIWYFVAFQQDIFLLFCYNK